MNNKLKKEENKNSESDYILFHFNHNKDISKKSSKYSKQNNINSSNNSLENIISNKDNNFDINKENKKDNSASPFTNLILREKINSAKFNNILRNGEKLKLKNNKNNISNDNTTKGFLIINKYETSVQNDKSNKLINNEDNIISLKGNMKIMKKAKSNLSESHPGKEKILKVSTGQQTFMDINSRNEINNNREYNYYNHNIKKNKNVINIPIRNNKLTKNSLLKFDSESEKLNINPKISNFENNSSSSTGIYLANPKIKQKNKSTINKFIKSEKFNNNSNDFFDSFSVYDIYVSSNNTNHSNNKVNKTHKLIKNNSNIVNFQDVKINERKNFMSIRELYRQMISAKEKKYKKKAKSILKQNNLKKYLKKKNEKNKIKVFNSNLISLEQYTYEKMKKKREINNKINIIDSYGKRIVNHKIPVYYRQNIKTNSIKLTKNQLNENIFNNILRSLSSENNNKIYQEKNNKKFHINILTMLELNNKIKNKNSKHNNIFKI